MILCRRSHHRWPANVDELLGPSGPVLKFGHTRTERIEVANNEIDWINAVGRHVGLVLWVVAVSENAAVHLGMQRDDPMAEHHRRAGVVGDVDDRHTRSGDFAGGATTGNQLPTEINQSLSERGDTGLVVHREQSAARGIRRIQHQRRNLAKPLAASPSRRVG